MNKLIYFYEETAEPQSRGGIVCGESGMTSEIIYRAEEGDGVFLLAKKFNCPPSRIIADNNLKEQVKKGELLIISKGEYPLYKVAAGETAQDVCSRFNVSESEFLAENKITYLFAGQLVRVKF